jgi:hypothetical protein
MPSRYQISTTVQKKLKDMNLTAEEVIRKALDIKSEGLATAEGVFFPEGTAFLGSYKDDIHIGKVKEGMIQLNGKSFSSVSGAAASITGRPTTNGWDFWLVKFPGKNEVVPIKTLRTAK